MAISQIPVKLIFHSFSDSSTFGRPGLGRSTPSSKAISQIPALIWELIFGRPCIGRSTPCQMAISQISALTAHISFLLWELIIWQTRSWQIYLPSNGDFTDSCSDSSLLWELIIWQTRSWQIYPPIKWQFHRFLLWQLPTLRAQHLTDQVLADLNPHIRWHFHRFLWNSYIIPTLRAQHLADQVLADLLPPIKWQFHRFLLYSESSYLSVQMFSDQPPTH